MILFFIILGALLSITIPLFMAVSSWAVFYIPSRYARRMFFKRIGWTSNDPAARSISLALTPWVYMTAGWTSASISIFFELIGAAMLMIIGLPDNWSAFLLVVSAGPIEEGAKFLCALVLFIVLDWAILRKARGERAPVKDAIMAGFLVGCSFGLIESIGYLAMGFSGIIKGGISYETLDPVIWRTLLGVPIHGLYTAIACIGLGRRTAISKIALTIVGLLSATILHSLNNAVQGLFVFILEREGPMEIMIVDALQIGLIFFGAILLITAWNLGTGGKEIPGKRKIAK
ncbi:MAG: PrsW family glutamic-type intramembrane protease [Candidatus Thermoplasmatota archaeon]|nr:PrsW family glutamic-type intramembrane protease [Candidatus Thermoplasmatota archaeon]